MSAHRVLFVCMGNICRSPTAEGVLRARLEASGLADQVLVDSAATHGWHAGAPPDPRSVRHAAQRGYDLSSLRARAVRDADFEQFDQILAMDWDNLKNLEARCPPESRFKLGRLTQYARRFDSPTIPDPYQGGPAEFEQVLDLVEDATEGLVQHLTLLLHRRHGTS